MTSTPSVPSRFVMWLETRSDWLCSTGAGSAIAGDREQRLDGEGLPNDERLPMLGGRQLKGDLRLAGLQVALGLDGEKDEFFARTWLRMMGDENNLAARPRTKLPAVLYIGSALVPEPIARRLRDKPALVVQTVLGRTRNRHSRATRQSADDMLLRQQVARGGVALAAPCSHSGLDATEFALVVAACIELERIGAVRNRGLGWVRVHLANEAGEVIEPDVYLDWLESVSSAPPSSAPEKKDQPDTGEGRAYSDIAARDVRVTASLTVEIKTLSALVVEDFVQGNVIHTLDYIPGRMLLPAISRAIGEQRTSTLIAEGRLVIRNAYPSVGGRRSIPVPLAFSARAGLPSSDTTRARNGLVDSRPDEKFKALEAGYVAESVDSTGRLTRTRPAVRQRLHNRIEPDTGATPLEGGVFAISSVAEGLIFKAEVHLDGVSDDEVERIVATLAEFDRMGRYRSAEYGCVEIKASRDVATSREVAAPSNVSEGTEWELGVVLASDTVVLGDDLAAATTRAVPGDSNSHYQHETLLIAALRDAFVAEGLEVLDIRASMVPDDDETREALAMGTSRSDGFNSRWGLGRDSIVGLKAGSCGLFIVRLNTPVAAHTWTAALASIERRGLGYLVAEGFGEVRFNSPLLWHSRPAIDDVNAHTPSPPRVEVLSAGLKVRWEEYLSRLEEAAAIDRCRRFVRRWLAQPGNQLVRLTGANLSQSQLGTLRGLATSTSSETFAALLEEFVSPSEGSKGRTGGFRKAIGPLALKLSEFASAPGELLDAIGFDATAIEACSARPGANGTERWTEERKRHLGILLLRELVVELSRRKSMEAKVGRLEVAPA